MLQLRVIINTLEMDQNMNGNNIPVGYKAIIEKLNIQTLPHYRESYIALKGRGKIIIDNNYEKHIYPKTYALKDAEDLLENLEFALKNDGINLEIIKGLFQKINKESIVSYIQKQPTGIYSRKIWFLYEFMMHELLPLKDCKKIKYVNLLDPTNYYTGPIIKSSRHAINNNLLGNDQFCPFIRRTNILDNFIKLDLDKKVRALLKKYDSHLLARASNYLYTKETMSSYQIEKEEPDTNRISRFIHLLEHSSVIEKLSKQQLIELQNIIVDYRFKNTDYRHNQNYVGENIKPFFQKIHYISPKYEDVPELMQGLLDTFEKLISSEMNPVLVAAVISFGFVYIHPFEDGNGRIHRFLIHYILARMEFTPKGMVFPVSSVMLNNMHEYDQVLEIFSKPLLSVLTKFDLSDEGRLTINQDSKCFYQYIDFTLMTEYLFKCIEMAIDKYIEREINFLINYDKTKQAIQKMVDMPDNQIDLLIKLVLQNKGKLSSNKRSKFEMLTDDEITKLSEIITSLMIEG